MPGLEDQGWGLSRVAFVSGWEEKDREANPEQGDSGQASAERCGDARGAPPIQMHDREGAEDKGVWREGAASPAYLSPSSQVLPPSKGEIQARKVSWNKAGL